MLINWPARTQGISKQRINLVAPENSGGHLNIKMSFYQYRDPMLKIRWSHDCLIFNMGILIPGKDGLSIETGSRFQTLRINP